MSPRHRIPFVALITLAAGLYVASVRLPHPERLSDLQQVLVAAKGWLAGGNPYAAVSSWPEFPFPLLYPFTAVVVAAPLTLLPRWLAEAAFVALGSGLLAWSLTRHARDAPKLLLFGSAPFLHAVVLVQWSPLLAAAALAPWAGFVLACKPNIGLALLAAYPRLRTGVSIAVLVALSFVLWPGWLIDWRAALAGAPNAISVVTLPGGILLLLAALRWGHSEGRLLLALSLVPQTTLAYEALPLFLIARTWREAWIIWGGTELALLGHGLTGPYPSQLAWVRAGGLWLLYCAYLPCLVIVLRRRHHPAGAIDEATD